MKNTKLYRKFLSYSSILALIFFLSSCGCNWAVRNCPGTYHTDTVKHLIIKDTTFFDTTFLPVPDDIIRLRALALIDELGFVQLPKTSVTDSKGNEINVEIVHDTVIAEAICRHRDNLLITKNRFRSEFKSEQTSTERVITAPVKRCPLFKLFIIGLIVGVTCTCLFLFFRKRYSLTPKT